MKITYSKCGDYYIPNIEFPEQKIFGKYGKLRWNYLKEHDYFTYTIMLMNGTLQDHLVEIDNTAKKRIDYLIKEIAKRENVDEDLKSTDQLKWVRNDE